MRPADLSDEDIKREKEAENMARAEAAKAVKTDVDDKKTSAVAKLVEDGKVDAPIAKKVDDKS
jgi:hypothetical protein